MIDIRSAAFAQNPYAHYTALRQDGEVHYLSDIDYWIVLGYDEVVKVLFDPDTFSSKINESFDPILLGADPPGHTGNRKALEGMVGVFSKKRIQAKKERIEQIVDLVIEQLPRQQFDIMSDFAQPISTLVILEVLGINTGVNQELISWTRRSVANASLHNIDYSNSDWASLRPIVVEYVENAYTVGGEGLSEIVSNDQFREGLSKDELIDLVKILLIGGNETTPSLIGSALFLLLSDIDLLSKVKDKSELIPLLIEETLRLESPTQIVHRNTTKEVVLGGAKIPAGARLMVCIGAANRDGRVFDSPDEFVLNRERGKPIPFGFGPHHCIGFGLAKLEAHVAIEHLLKHFPSVSLRKGFQPLYRLSSHIHGLESLPVTTD